MHKGKLKQNKLELAKIGFFQCAWQFWFRLKNNIIFKKAKGTLAPERGLDIVVYAWKMQQAAGTLEWRSTITL